MSEFDDEQSFQCPYCASLGSLSLDISGGSHQSFTTDCEVCCRPILMTITIDEEGVPEIDAQRES